jgi:hypothetical protein
MHRITSQQCAHTGPRRPHAATAWSCVTVRGVIRRPRPAGRRWDRARVPAPIRQQLCGRGQTAGVDRRYVRARGRPLAAPAPDRDGVSRLRKLARMLRDGCNEECVSACAAPPEAVWCWSVAWRAVLVHALTVLTHHHGISNVATLPRVVHQDHRGEARAAG